MVAQLERPESPSSVHETGLDPGFLADLTLKTLYFGGNISGSELVERLHLPLTVVAETLAFLRKQRLAEVTGGSGLNPVVVVLGVFLALLLLYFFVRLRRGRPTKEEEAATGEAKPSEASAEKPPEGTPEKTSETAKGDQAAVAAAPAFKAKRTRAVALASPPAETKPEAQTEAKAEPAASVATCIICGKGAAEAEVIECGKCDKPMHERCGDTVPMCPNCGAKFA